MSLSDELQTRRLIAPTYVPTAEIIVLDNEGAIVARSTGTLQADLTPGIYQLRYRVGNKVTDKIVLLHPGDGAISVEPPVLPIEEPSVLADSPGTSEESFNRIQANSRQTDLVCGQGSRISFFIDPRVSPTTLQGFTLRDFNDHELACLSAARLRGGCLITGIDIDPGSYLIRLKDAGCDPIEQTVVACEGWQTQLFLDALPSTEPIPLDLVGCSVLMCPLKGPAPKPQSFRWTDAARQSLANRRAKAAPVETLKERVRYADEIRHSNLDPTMLQDMLHAKFVNPMLGIYGAHLLMLNPEPDKDLLREVHKNLRSLIGDHPDVVTIALFLDGPTACKGGFPLPPMLRSSWEIIDPTTPERASLVPPASYSFRIAARLWGAGAWLAWRRPPAESGIEVAPAPVDWSALFALGTKLLARGGQAQIPAAMNNESLTPTERAVLGHLVNAAARVVFTKAFASEADRDKVWHRLAPVVRYFAPSEFVKGIETDASASINAEQISKATGLPYSAIESAASSLGKKLAADPSLTGGSAAALVTTAISGLAKRIGLAS